MHVLFIIKGLPLWVTSTMIQSLNVRIKQTSIASSDLSHISHEVRDGSIITRTRKNAIFAYEYVASGFLFVFICSYSVTVFLSRRGEMDAIEKTCSVIETNIEAFAVIKHRKRRNIRFLALYDHKICHDKRHRPH